MKVSHHGERIVDTIKKNNQRRHRVTTEEMKAVLEERDIAVMKVGITVDDAKGFGQNIINVTW